MKNRNKESLLSNLADVFLHGRTSIEERERIAFSWSAGDYTTYVRIAEEKRISPIALIVASLIDSEHPIYCPNGKPCTPDVFLFAKLVRRVEGGELSHRTVYKSVKPVDKCLKSVDKSVEKSVDKIATYPQASYLVGITGF